MNSTSTKKISFPSWVILLLIILVLPAGKVFALERFDVVTTEELQKLLEERAAAKADFILINTLDAMIAKHHSIPGSINLPWSKVTEKKALLGEDKGKLIITYCMGYR